jgi:hypothetical protein
MWPMSEAEPPEDHEHGLVHGIAERITGRRRRAEWRHEDEELASAAQHAGYDLGADIAHPVLGHAVAGYDLDTDIGIDNEPPELRD